MKIIFSKHIKLQSAIVSMVIEEEQKREDIQRFLQGKETFNDEILEERVREYLIGIGVYKSNMKLTQRGEKVKDSGFLATKEQGKFPLHLNRKDHP